MKQILLVKTSPRRPAPQAGAPWSNSPLGFRPVHRGHVPDKADTEHITLVAKTHSFAFTEPARRILDRLGP